MSSLCDGIFNDYSGKWGQRRNEAYDALDCLNDVSNGGTLYVTKNNNGTLKEFACVQGFSGWTWLQEKFYQWLGYEKITGHNNINKTIEALFLEKICFNARMSKIDPVTRQAIKCQVTCLDPNDLKQCLETLGRISAAFKNRRYQADPRNYRAPEGSKVVENGIYPILVLTPLSSSSNGEGNLVFGKQSSSSKDATTLRSAGGQSPGRGTIYFNPYGKISGIID